MKRIAKFHKVSSEQFSKDWKDTFGEVSDAELQNIYDSLRLPRRATTGSAGYDFYAPVDVTMKPGEIVKIPTGIRVEMEEGWVLKCYPRSGLGFKFRLQLNNTVGIIDRAVPWKSFIRRDRQRSYPPAGITATEYQHIRLCKKHQDSVIQRDAQALSGTD